MLTIILYKHQIGKPNIEKKNPKIRDNIQPVIPVYICSPFKGDISVNRAKARLYCRFAYEKGYLPIAPHIYFPQFLDEDVKEERAEGIKCGLGIMRRCRQLWVFGNRISDGMKAEIKAAKELGLTIRYFDSGTEEISD